MPGVKERIRRAMSERKKTHEDMKAIINLADKENRELSADEQKKLDDMNARMDEFDSRIATLESMNEREEEYDEPDDDDDDRDNDDDDTIDPEDEGKSPRSYSRSDIGKTVILGNGLRARIVGVNGSRIKVKPAKRQRTHQLVQRPGETREAFRQRVARSRPEYREAFGQWLRHERSASSILENRALQADLDVQGGFLTAPEEFVNQILKTADNLLFIRRLGTVFRVNNAQSLGVPSLENDPSDADWTSEIATGNEDSAMNFGKRELVPRPVAKRIKMNRKLLGMSSVSGVLSINDESQNGQGSGFERFVTGRLGYKFAVTEEKAFMTGNGVGQPLGLFVASNRGISTARDVASGASGAITFDSLFDMLYSLKAPYQATCQWLWSRAAMQRIRKLKDNQNRYLWEPSTQAGEPNRLLDRPTNMSEYVPNTFTSNAYVGLLGDFSYYWIADSEVMQMQRLDELYAETNQVGYIGRMELDGMPAMEEAFARLQLS